MCSLFRQMENHQGDLADIVRARGGGGGGGGSCTSGGGGKNNQMISSSSDWKQFPSQAIKLFPSSSSSSGIVEPSTAAVDNFGDPFSSTRDPLLHELDITAGSSSGFFDRSNDSMDIPPAVKMMSSLLEDDTSTVCSSLLAQRILDEEMKIRPCNIFSRMLQISPNTKMIPVSPRDLSVAVASPRGTTNTSSSSSSLVVNNDMVKANSSTGCTVDNSGLQISSPRNTGIKRRKSQAKKVVCIPAPAAANSRPSGEVVPSDLWAWRKYGQKPIKGSPYPRGYYRCSSSKGCSARKQVERSRTDPNMLVITYTSEHNHPWPTQRNALAGSTRSQPTKSINAGSSKMISSPPSSNQSTSKLTSLLLKDEEHKENNNNISSSSVVIAGGSVVCSIKEEMGETSTDQKPIDDHMCDMGVEYSPPHHQGFYEMSYGPIPTDVTNIIHSDDFFADLGEFETDPLNLLFSPQGFPGEKSSDEKKENNKLQALDPFSLFDWTGLNNNSFDHEESSRRGRGL